MAVNDGVYWQRHYMTQRDPFPKNVFKFWADPGSGFVEIKFYAADADDGKPPGSDPPAGSQNITLKLTEGVHSVLRADSGTGEEWRIIDALNVCAGALVLYIRIEADTGAVNDADYGGGLKQQWTD